MQLALYPGSFDPVTIGHINLIERAALIFPRVVVAVAHNPQKKSLFTVEERQNMLKVTLQHLMHVHIDRFQGLLVSYAHQIQATIILRGLRAVSDFDYEFQLAYMNRHIGQGLETLFMTAGDEHSHVSSSLVREVASLGGSVHGLVPAYVEKQLKEKFQS